MYKGLSKYLNFVFCIILLVGLYLMNVIMIIIPCVIYLVYNKINHIKKGKYKYDKFY
jgi:hypothetical protein